MSLNTQANATAIMRDLAAKSGVELTASGLDVLALIAQSEFNWDGGEITGRDASGNAIPAATWFKAKLDANPNWTATTKTTTTTPPEGETMTARALRLNAERRTGGAKTAAAEKLVAEHGNPWRKNAVNRAHQGFLLNHAPDLAGRLRAEAGQ